MTLRNAASRPALAALAVLCFGPAARAESIDDVLARMDTAAKQFRSYSANVKELRYGAVLESRDDSSGVMRLMRTKNGVVGVMDMTAGQDHTIIHFNGNTVDVYLPKANTVQRFKVKQYAATMDQMLLLGFAVTGDEIKRGYDVKLAGGEVINGVAAAHVVLTPKSAEALKYVKTFELWIGPNGNALRQKGTQPDGDYRMETYSDLKLNPALPESAFELNLPPGTQVVKEN